MKKLLLSVVVASVAFVSVTANAGLKFVGETKYAGLCEAAATNDTNLLEKSVSQHASEFGLSRNRMLAIIIKKSHFSCGGKGLVEFSEIRGSSDVVNYLTLKNSQATPKIEQASSKYKFVGDRDYASFCKSAINNDLGQFKRAIKSKVGRLASSREEVLNIALEGENISCDGVSLAEFFEKNNATNVLDYITK